MGIIFHKPDSSNIEYHELQPKVNCECDTCHCKFTRTRGLLKRNLIKNSNPKIYCSPFCAKQASFNNSAKTFEFTCSHCNKTQTRLRREFKQNNRNIHFCSKQCSVPFLAKERKEKNKKIISFLIWLIAKTVKFDTKEKKVINKSVLKKTSQKIKKVTEDKPFDCSCLLCLKLLTRKASEIKKSKHGRFFCSKKCRMIWYNKNTKNSTLKNKSKAESILFNLIKNDFPNLTIEQNNRTVIPNGLEIDILIPELKLAIELNGPVHYFPIFGTDRLKTVKDKDLIKQQEAISKGFRLLVIDISRLKGEKQTTKFLDTYYNSHVKPIINEL